ncbi:TetR-like C-terminal domain-containing protein [Streptomyces sp. NBC_00328]|uniref:TetR-like C-terminal domain-containing protein n=1 Tax=Streptomyces sp. NBC_00328 TaxID=2903646 RepID=UPI002E27EE24|nr:TetR-like C-terminal domain-containing protein [Streptomyces sp. NBC_00328]
MVLDRARTRGDLPPRPAASTVLDIVFGTLWYRLLATRRPMGDDLVEDLTATLTQAAQPSANTAIDLGDEQ